MNKYKVSIIVPVYNVADVLDRCVRSILNQSYRSLEIILVDDGSPDSSGKMCDYYSTIDTRVKVIHKINGGLSDARNYGIDKATGDYIMFIDSDDYIEEDSVEILVGYAVKNKLDIACADANRIIEVNGEEKLERLIGDMEQERILTGEEFLINSIRDKIHSVAVWSRLYKTTLIKDNNILFKRGIYHEDEEWTPRIMLKAQRVSYINYPFYYYIIRNNSITQTGNRNKHIKDVIEICSELECFYEKNINKEENKKIAKDYLAKLYINTSIFGTYDRKYYKSIINKSFPLKNSKFLSTKIQAIIFSFNPGTYRMLKLFYLDKIV